MVKYYLGKLLQYLLIIVLTLTLNFFLPRMMPGDPLKYILGENAASITPEMRAELMAKHGLDKSLLSQYGEYIGNLLRGDLGYSYQKSKPVITLIGEKLPWTLLLSITNIVLTTIIGVVLGSVAAWNRGKSSDVTMSSAMVFLKSMPSFWVGMILIAIFGTQLGWLPSFGAQSAWSNLTGFAKIADIAKHMILPSATLLLISVSTVYMTMRYSMIDTLGEDYILLARLKGVAERNIKYKHAMQNALIPVVTVVMMDLGYMVGGATVIETVFAYPGTGRLLFEALSSRDYPLIQGCFLITTICVLAANFLADLMYPLIDPKAV
ncbi:MAG: ABC transporter permease [Clostridiaceae bacterium]|nr:ABC transporter permease [Eubacteriales bacterium]